MAETKFNIDELKEVVLKVPSGSSMTYTYPKGIDFPNGTSWRKPIKVYNPAPPIADVVYRRGHLANTTPSEHTGIQADMTRTPRWHDTDVKAFLNMPLGWTCDSSVTTNIDKIITDPDDDSTTAWLTAEQGVCAPEWCLIDPVVANGTYTATLEIYNPSAISVSWDLIRSSDNVSFGSTFCVDWSSSNRSSSRIISPKTTEKFSISCDTEMISEITGLNIVFTSVEYLTSQSTYQSKGWTLNEYSRPNQVTATSSFRAFTTSSRLSKLPVEIRYVAKTDGGYSTYYSIKNPFSVLITYLICPRGTPGHYSTNQYGSALPDKYTITANTTSLLPLYSPMSEDYLACDYIFLFYIKDAGAEQPASYTALERKVYPIVVSLDYYSPATAHGGAGSVSTLTFYNPNSFAVNLSSEIYVDDSTVTYSAPAQGISIGADSRYSVKLTFEEDYEGGYVYIDGRCYATANIPENGALLASPETYFHFSLQPILEPPSVQSASQEDGYYATLDVSNENDYDVYCRVATTYSWEEYRDDGQGYGSSTETLSSTIFAIKKVAANSTTSFGFAFSDSVTVGDASYHVTFISPESRMSSTAVEGFYS